MDPHPGAVITTAIAGFGGTFVVVDIALKFAIGVATLVYICLGIRNRWKNKQKENDNE